MQENQLITLKNLYVMLVLLCLALVAMVPADDAIYRHFLLYTGYAVSALAIYCAFARGGIYWTGFWYVLAAAYPLLSPFLIQDLVGMPYFSGYALFLQDAYIMGEPVLVGGLATLLMALLIKVPRSDLNSNGSSLNSQSIHPSGNRPALGTGDATVLILGSAPLILFFAWLTEPGRIIGMANYTALRDERFTGTNFAGGAWLIFQVVGLGGYLRLRSENARQAKTFCLLYWIVTFLSFLWLFLHARRSETLGFAVLLFCILSNNDWHKSTLAARFLNRRVMVLTLILVCFVVIGYFRSTLGWDSLQRRAYLQAPGGSGNNLLTYLATYDLVENGQIKLTPGITYWYQIMNIPPRALGLPRAPSAYEFVDDNVRLMGGEYWLMEPVMNGGIAAITIFTIVLSIVVGRCTTVINRYKEGRCGLFHFLISAMFIALLFRTMWYGPDAAVSGFIMAVMVGTAWKILTLGKDKRMQYGI